MQTLKIKAPAKINLYLAVLSKRPDGYHDIETIFEKIDLCDEVILTKRKQGIKLNCLHSDLPQDKKNLALQAAQALLKKTKPNAGVHIRLVKKIPVAAGLGGGSSDAAAVLLGLNRLWDLGLARSELFPLAAQLGADVPFFILPAIRAIGRGKGELLSPLRYKAENWYVLVIARECSVSTQRMYQALRLALTKRPCGVKIVLRALKRGDLTSLNKYSYNSFEPVLKRRYKQISQIQKALRSSGVRAALISGSGPCVFGITKTRKEAMDIKGRLRRMSRSWQVIVTKTLKED